MIDEPVDTMLEAKRRAAIAILTKIETTSNAPGDNHYEIRQLSKAYREIVGPGREEESTTSEFGTTLEAPELNHVAALEHFYQCMCFDACLKLRIGSISYEDAQHDIDAIRQKQNATDADLLGARLEIDALRAKLQDADAARAILGEELEKAHAQIRELSPLASSAPNLRNELQAANEEVASLRQTRSTLASMTIERDKFAGLLGTIRFLLAKDGFNGDNLPQLVETALESLHEAQKERDDLAKRLDATRGALHIANSQLGVANSNLTNALKLHQGSPDALTPLMRAAAKIIAFWRRGDESYQLAANELENALAATIGESWRHFKSSQGTNEMGASILAVEQVRS